MPRWEKNAESLIYECLSDGPKTWGALMKKTNLSNAQVSRTLHKLIETGQVFTTSDSSKRPAITFYNLDKKKAQLRITKPLLPQKKGKGIFFPELGKYAQKQPAKLGELIKLELILLLSEEPPVSVAMPSDEDIDMPSYSSTQQSVPFTDREVANLCMTQFVKAAKRSMKFKYGIDVLEDLMREEAEKLWEEGFFDVGQKSLVGIRVKEKLADYYLSPGQDSNEIEELNLATIKKIKMGVSWKSDFFRLLYEAQQLKEKK